MAENAQRPNKKAWKKKWGKDGPPGEVVLVAREQSAQSKRKKGNN